MSCNERGGTMTEVSKKTSRKGAQGFLLKIYSLRLCAFACKKQKGFLKEKPITNSHFQSP